MPIRGICHCGRVAYRLDGEPGEAIYTFGKHVIRHQFCKTCGCAPFGEGSGPDGKEMVAVNLRCVEEIDLSKLTISQFDGAAL